jgi:hypothetical protein
MFVRFEVLMASIDDGSSLWRCYTVLSGSHGLLDSEEEGTIILSNIGNCLPVNMV